MAFEGDAAEPVKLGSWKAWRHPSIPASKPHSQSIYPVKFFAEKECNEFNRGPLSSFFLRPSSIVLLHPYPQIPKSVINQYSNRRPQNPPYALYSFPFPLSFALSVPRPLSSACPACPMKPFHCFIGVKCFAEDERSLSS